MAQTKHINSPNKSRDKNRPLLIALWFLGQTTVQAYNLTCKAVNIRVGLEISEPVALIAAQF